MSIKSRVLAIGGSIVLVASLAAVATAVSVATPQASGAAKTAVVKANAEHETGSSEYNPFTVYSPDFTENGWLPVSSEGGPASETGCSGKNLAPTIDWSNVPSGTESFAFVISDVDAPVAGFFHHWIVYNIPANVTSLAGHGSDPYSEGTNDYGFVGYGGPCPPADGQTHHYVFTVYALDTTSIPGTALDYSQLVTAITYGLIAVTSWL
jgi:Raf kinase inhibitor-like YbhB/YbcL family protein